MTILRAIGLALALGAAGVTQAAAQPAPPESAQAREIQSDPAVRRGRLENGLEYAILRNARPERGVSLRLLITTGSFEEADGEQGVAHFLEHMAFNGTRHFPEGQLQARFAEAGVAFGRDQNASTGAFATIYKLDLSLGDPDRLDLAFHWLNDVAEGLELSPDAVDRERGVVLAEYESRLGAAWNWRQRYNRFAARGLRGPQRLAIGTPASIAAIDADMLRAFHTRWYRPDNAMVIVTGDIDEADIEARIRATFDDWRAVGAAPQRVAPGQPDLNRRQDVLSVRQRDQGSGMSICRRQPFVNRGGDSYERRRHNIERGFWLSILNRRLQRLTQGEAAPFVSASLSTTNWPQEVALTCLTVTPRGDGRWSEGMAAAAAEIRRMEVHGVTRAELDRALALNLRDLESAVVSADNRFSATLADTLLRTRVAPGLEASGFARPEEDLRLYRLISAGITPESVNAVLRAAWAGAEPLIAATAAEAPPRRAVGNTWRQAMRVRSPEPWTEPAQGVWAYSGFGEPGEVASREEIATPGFTRFRFANGVVVNFKTTTFTRDQVLVAVRFGAGLQELAADDYQAGALGSGLISSGGLGAHSAVEIRDLFPDRRYGSAFNIGSRAFGMNGTTRPADLDIQLQLLAAYLSDPGFRSDYDAARINAIDTRYRRLRSDPNTVANIITGEAVTPGGPRNLPAKEQMMALGQDDFARILKPAMLEAPLEVTVVGDVNEATALPLLAATFGALPPRTDTDRRNPTAWFLHYPDTVAPIRGDHDGARDQAVVRLIWPLYVGEPARRREDDALRLLRGILADAVRDEVREALGASYSPNVTITLQDDADQGAMAVLVGTRPSQAEAAMAAVKAVAARLADGGVTAEALETARRPVLDGGVARRQTNGWWMATLNGSSRNPELLAEQLGWEESWRTLTVEEVQAAATTWLSRTPIEVMVLPSSSATTNDAR